ncbi:DNA-directed RNA polymerase subunit alpha [Candidatus Uhrbacteria bacterium]|nr:DNA-directed RNA polymerase subunit alpha [Candidatus Uhrbacteria bacterium]
MPDYTIILPSKPKIIKEEGASGVYEIDSLYPGYGHTLGNSLRRIILSSLPGAAITSVKIEGVSHEFSTMPGVKEDCIALLLNLRKLNFQIMDNEAHEGTLTAKGVRKVSAREIEVPSQVELLNPEQHIAELTEKNASLSLRIRIEKRLGYVPKGVLFKDKVEAGTIPLDAVFTPIRRVNYEVENMRVGDRTDYNKLRIFIETNGTILPREALEASIHIMIQQLKAIVGFQEERLLGSREETEERTGEGTPARAEAKGEEEPLPSIAAKEDDKEALKVRIDSIDLSSRLSHALEKANIRTLGGLVRKSEEELLKIEGLGEKGITEIKKKLSEYGVTLK